MLNTFLLALYFMIPATLAAAGELRAPSDKPNFVVIFVDDLGYGDMGCFGSTKNRTPQVDKMAAEGMKFTDFYVTSGVCSPSRSSLMTGCYPLRIGMHESERGCFVIVPRDKRGLNPDEITVAEVLKQQGYATTCIGKWHLGDQPPFLPCKQGFDEYYGIPFSNDMGSREKGKLLNGLPELPLLRNDTVIEAPVDQTTITKRYTEEAITFIRAHKDEPFFVYLPHTMVHSPRFSSPAFAGKSKNGAYGDAVEEVDWSTGQILDTLKELGIDKNTMVIFTSDNGATKAGSNAPLAGWKISTLEGGMRVPFVAWWPGTIPAAKECHELASTIDVMPTFAKLAGTKPPTDRIIDGRDIAALLTGTPNAKTPHDAYYYYFMSQLQCVRSGKWKLHLALTPQIKGWMGEEAENTAAKLYDLDADPAEATDLSAANPEVVTRLNALAEIARKDIGDYKIKSSGQRPPGFFPNPELVRMKPE